VDGRRISLAGESAGGQLVTQVVSLPCAGCEVAAVVSLYGVYDFTQFTKQAEDRRMLDRIFGKWTTQDLKEASPIEHIGKGLPPLLLIQGTQDELYPGTLAYERALTAAGIEHELVVLDGAPHGMENWVSRPDWLKSLDRAMEWLRRH
jgi:acetyl esterase/lipase